MPSFSKFQIPSVVDLIWEKKSRQNFVGIYFYGIVKDVRSVSLTLALLKFMIRPAVMN
jgi:hypothetical protein